MYACVFLFLGGGLTGVCVTEKSFITVWTKFLDGKEATQHGRIWARVSKGRCGPGNSYAYTHCLYLSYTCVEGGGQGEGDLCRHIIYLIVMCMGPSRPMIRWIGIMVDAVDSHSSLPQTTCITLVFNFYICVQVCVCVRVTPCNLFCWNSRCVEASGCFTPDYHQTCLSHKRSQCSGHVCQRWVRSRFLFFVFLF